MELSIFDELKAGANFSSGNNKEHLIKFKQAAASTVQEEFQAGAHNVAESLDFFGSLGGGSGGGGGGGNRKASGKKKKKTAQAKAPKSQTPKQSRKSPGKGGKAGRGALPAKPLLLQQSTPDSSSDGSSSDSSSSDDEGEDEDEDEGVSARLGGGLLLFASPGGGAGDASDSDDDGEVLKTKGEEEEKKKKQKKKKPKNVGKQAATSSNNSSGSSQSRSSSSSSSSGGGGAGAGGGTAEGGDGLTQRQRREQISAFRHRMNIRIKGADVCDPLATFRDMGPCGDGHIKRVLLQNIEKSMYKEPTPIQMQAVPLLLRRRDLLAAAPTGSGKTAAFVLPILGALAVPIKQKNKNKKNKKSQEREAEEEGGDEKKKKKKQQAGGGSGAAPNGGGSVRAIIVAPTRELAAQIQREVSKLAEGKKFRAVVLSKATLASVASAPTDILVTTPLRLLDALQTGKVDASSLEFFVLDEADKLFELGFVEQLDQILALIKAPGLTRAFFSATLPEGVEALARSVLVDPVRVVIGVRNAGASTIDQQLLFVGQEQGKLQAMRQLIAEGLKPPCILFVQSKERAVEVFQELVYEGINVEVLHSDRTQAQRDRIVDQFRVGKIWVLIATDIVARGMDFQGVNTVINFDFPQSSVSYVHRIGRTGRAGRRGKAVTFFTEADFPALRSIANVMKLSGCDVPDWMLRLKTMKTKDKRRYRNSVPERHSVRTTAAFDKKRKARRDNIVAQSSKEAHQRKQARASKHKSKQGKGGSGGGGGDGDDDGGGWTLVQ